jgi:hypothetical protein
VTNTSREYMGRVPWKCWSPGEKEQGYVTLVALSIVCPSRTTRTSEVEGVPTSPPTDCFSRRWLYRFQHGLDLCFGLKAFLKAA